MSEVEFKNLKEIDLSHNNISNIQIIKNFKNLKCIDLSYNKINDIQSLNDIITNNKEIEKINLNNNEIYLSNDKNIKEKLSRHIEINLDKNNIIKKEVESIKNSVNKIFGSSHLYFGSNPLSLTGIQRISLEFKDLQIKPFINFDVCVGLPNAWNIFKWWVSIFGPKDTPYRGGLFYLKVLLPPDYPLKAPEIKFLTPIYHPNVNNKKFPGEELGKICLPKLAFWKQNYTMHEILENICTLFYFVNLQSPYNLDMRYEIRNNHSLYEEKIIKFTKKYANPSIDFKIYDEWDFTI